MTENNQTMPDHRERILIVDDDPGVRTFLENAFRVWGFESYLAEDGRQGLEALRSQPPFSLAMVDLRMPVLDGFGFLREVSRPEVDLPVIVISGAGEMKDSIEALRLGAYDYLVKPITDLALLRRSVERGLERYQLKIEKKAAENRLRDIIQKQLLQLRRMRLLQEVGEALQSTFESDVLLHMILTACTAGVAIGFNRAAIFLLNEDAEILAGRMGVGPATGEEAGQIWTELSTKDLPLSEMMSRHPTNLGTLDRIIRQLSVNLEEKEEPIVSAIQDRRGVEVFRHSAGGSLTRALRDRLGMFHFVVEPLLARGKALGVLVADTAYIGGGIDADRIRLLQMLSHQAGMALDNCLAYQRLAEHLQNLTRTQQELVQAERMAALGRMSAQVAHEIRNPLAGIGGFARRILKYGEGNEKIEQACSIITEQVERLEATLQNISNFARPGVPTFRWVQLNNLASAAQSVLRENAEKHQVGLNLDLDPNLPEIECDPSQIQQVLINLTKNGIEAMQNGGTLTIRTRLLDRAVHIEVRDTGMGMDDRVLGSVFDPFFTTKSVGTGLGLAVARKTVMDHGGTIEIDSKPAEGTTVRIILPVQPPGPRQEAEVENTGNG